MNILQLESSLYWGGCEKRCIQEVAWLRRHGHNAWLACDPRSQFFKRADGEILPCLIPVRYSFAMNPLTVAELFKIVRERKIEVVHCHEALDSTLALWLHLAGVPLVRSRHWMLSRESDRRKRFFFRHSCRKLIAASREIYKTFVENYKVPEEKVCVIGEGTEPAPSSDKIESLRKEFRQTWGIPEDAVVFAIVGIIRASKGHGEFVEAAFRVLEHHPKAWFLIVGQGNGNRASELLYIDRLREQIRKMKDPLYGHRLFFTGFYNDIAEPFAGADVVVIPSYTEAQSRVGPEAMIYGRAVIASRVGGLPEIIEHEKTGLLVAPRNIDELAAAMTMLAEDPELRQRFAKAGRSYAEANLRFDQRMEELVSCYQSCLNR